MSKSPAAYVHLFSIFWVYRIAMCIYSIHWYNESFIKLASVFVALFYLSVVSGISDVYLVDIMLFFSLFLMPKWYYVFF